MVIVGLIIVLAIAVTVSPAAASASVSDFVLLTGALLVVFARVVMVSRVLPRVLHLVDWVVIIDHFFAVVRFQLIR
jgi:hypothetical protein